MLRISNLIKSSILDTKERSLDGSIAIWNMTNRCNLSCMHCYSKATLDSKDLLSFEEIVSTLEHMYLSGVKFLIISGGEPLTRSDIFDIADACKRIGIITSLSTNGLYIHQKNVEKIARSFDYIGISIDGREETHDRFRALKGSYNLSINALKLLLEHTNRVGIRFTITKETQDDLPYIFELAEELNIPKIYISHLVYSGRGLDNLSIDLTPQERFEAVEFIIDKAFEYYECETPIDIVTGNMEMDSVLLEQRFLATYPEFHENLITRLRVWGGNSAGRKLLNIDSSGNVKPDPFSHIILGNIKERSFGQIWQDETSEMLEFLRHHPRQLDGKCENCEHLDICNGGSRARSWAIHEDIRASDPSCYLNEIFGKRD
jgi:Fe-coproporphyrin III synthase